MKYKELEKIAEKNGYEITNEIDYVILTKYEEDNIIKISTIKEDIIFSTMCACMPRDFQTLKASLELAETPLEDRYEEKKYYLKHRFIGEYDCDKFLNHELERDVWFLSAEDHFGNYQTQFTQKEIDEIKAKYDTTLDDFKQVEVKK